MVLPIHTVIQPWTTKCPFSFNFQTNSHELFIGGVCSMLLFFFDNFYFSIRYLYVIIFSNSWDIVSWAGVSFNKYSYSYSYSSYSPHYPRLQHSQVNDPTRPCKKSQTANQLSSTREDLGSNFIRQTIICQVDYNSFFDTYSLRWRHQYITIFKVKYSFCSYSSRKNFVHLDFSLKRSVTCVLHVTKKIRW